MNVQIVSRQMVGNEFVTEQLRSCRNYFHFLSEQKKSSLQIGFCLQTDCQRAIGNKGEDKETASIFTSRATAVGEAIFFSEEPTNNGREQYKMVTRQLGSGSNSWRRSAAQLQPLSLSWDWAPPAVGDKILGNKSLLLLTPECWLW